MFPTFLSLTVLLSLLVQTVFAGLSITTSPVVLTQCAKTTIKWSASKGPYDVILVRASDPCGTPLRYFGNTTKTSMTFLVNVTSGTEVMVSVMDDHGDEAWSHEVTVGSAADSSCLPASSGSGPSTSSGSASGGINNVGNKPFGGANALQPLRIPILAIGVLIVTSFIF